MIRTLLISLLLHSSLALAHWTHLELGAGNYGAEGHTSISQRKTVLMKLMATSKPNYVDELPEKDEHPYDPAVQYRVLFDTLDQLVLKFGDDNGTFYVNDLFPEYAEYAATKLSDYAAQKGYSNLEIKVLAGDYESIEFPGAPYDSVHLKNPEVSFYHDMMDGDVLSSTEQSRLNARNTIKKLASLSKEGLHLFLVNHESFIPPEEAQLMHSETFYKKTSDWGDFYYYYPEGRFWKVIPLVTNYFIPKDVPTSDL